MKPPFWCGSCRTVGTAVLLATLILASPRAIAQDPSRLAKAITRALAYDANLPARAGSRVTLAVLYRPGDMASQKEATLWHGQFSLLTSFRLLGLPFESVLCGYRSATEFRSAIKEQGIDAVFVCDGLDRDLAAIQKVTRQQKVISIASRKEQVASGLSLGVFPADSKAVLQVNLTAAKEEGAAFSGDMLKLAKIIR